MSQSLSHVTAANGVSASCRQKNTRENRFLEAVPAVYKKDATDARCVLVSAPERQVRAPMEMMLGVGCPAAGFACAANVSCLDQRQSFLLPPSHVCTLSLLK